MSNLLLNALKDVKRVAVGGHVRPDGDCVGSCLGLYNYIRDNYKDIQVDVYLETIPEAYRRVRGTDAVLSEVRPEKEAYDLFITLDCGDRERLGRFAVYYDRAARTVCIDHHRSNQAFAGENLIRPEASSTAEVLFDLMEEEKISRETAECLYMGIMCDTGCFKHSNVLEHTMTVAGKLITKGVNQSKMMDEVFYEKTFVQNQLLGRCLISSYLALDGRCIISVVSQELLKAYGAVPSDLEGVIDQLRVTKGVEVAVLVTETEDGGSKISMRSCEYADVSSVAVYFGGGGHIRAAGVSVDKKPEDILPELTEKIKEQLTLND